MDKGISVQGSSASKESKRRTTVKSGKNVFLPTSLIIEEERRLQEKRFWEMRSLQMCE